MNGYYHLEVVKHEMQLQILYYYCLNFYNIINSKKEILKKITS